MKSVREKNLVYRAKEALRSCLRGVPFAEIKSIQEEVALERDRERQIIDIMFRLDLPGGERYLLIEVKSSGQPRQARIAVNQLRQYLENYPKSYGIFMAPYISPAAAKICSEEGVGYIDFSGNCRLNFEQIYIEKEGKPNKFAKTRDLRSLYSPKAERVLRVLLLNPRKPWKIEGMAEEAEVSTGHVYNVKKLLADREWIKIEREGFMLTEPYQLLREWGENYSFRRNTVRDFYTFKGVSQIEDDLGQICGRIGLKYALTGFSGAVRLAPFVRYKRSMAYVEEIEESLVSLLDLKEVPSGANISLFLPYDDGVFYRASKMNGEQVVSPIQVYLDLLSFRGRGEEAAQTILDGVIRPQW